MKSKIDQRLLDAIRMVCEKREDVDCFEGSCGIFAVALNRFLGGEDDDEVFVGAYNTKMERKYGEHMYFHVAVLHGKILLDGTGITTRENLLACVETSGGGSARLRRTDGSDILVGTDAVTFFGRVGERALEEEIGRVESLLGLAMETHEIDNR